MAKGIDAGFAIGTFFYIIASVCLEFCVVPYLVTPNAPRLPYAQEAIFYVFVSGGLGAVGGQLFNWLKSGDPVKSAFLGLSIGSASLFLVALRCIRSTPPFFSIFDPSNIVLFGPLMIIAAFLILLGMVALFRSTKKTKNFSKSP